MISTCYCTGMHNYVWCKKCKCINNKITKETILLFQLGEHYLILAEEKDTEQNNRLAVDWLIKAAKQGRKGAARLLQRCWIQEKGSCSRIRCMLCPVGAFVFVGHICLFLFRNHAREWSWCSQVVCRKQIWAGSAKSRHDDVLETQPREEAKSGRGWDAGKCQPSQGSAE